MENSLMIFKNEEFGEIRSLEINNEPYFVGKDIAKALGYKNTKDALINHVDEDDKRVIQRSEVATIENHIPKSVFPVNFTNGEIPNRGLTMINESGIYSLVFGSKLPNAKKFKRWVTNEVLPSIRKHGGYIAGQEQMTDEELMAKAVLMANSKIQELNHKNKELEMQNSQLTVVNEIMRPKAEYFDELVDRNLLTSFRETAKTLGVKEKTFVSFLLEHKYIFRDKKGKLQPFADKNRGLFELKESKNEKTGWVGTQTLITPKGRETFRLLCVGL